MANRGNETNLHRFRSLPPELRQLIWKESVLEAMENSEVLILIPTRVRFGQHTIDKSTPFPPVNTGFPVAMHVNREARAIALMHIKLADLGRYPWTKCPVPQRPFRPEIDVLYAARSSDPHLDYLKADVVKVRHLALDYTGNIIIDMNRVLDFLPQHMPALRTVQFVLPTAEIDLCDGRELPLLPHRRCRLRPLEHEKLEQMRALSRKLLRQQSMSSMGHLVPSEYSLSLQLIHRLPPSPHLSTVEKMHDAIEESLRFRVEESNITFGVSLITEFCYLPSRDSRFVAVGEEFPDSPDPSVFAELNAPKSKPEPPRSLSSI
ncbi:hypothetical protein F4803DRAFT_345414 [Xylaria telfairii]|nr:hypothetical protein F4803DRAFT_345414 [Xylaria telfairii]